jgi:hypothetical protein
LICTYVTNHTTQNHIFKDWVRVYLDRITGGRECRSRDTPSAIDALSCINKKEPKFEREETQ